MKPTYDNMRQALLKLKSELTAQVLVLLLLCTVGSFLLGRYTLHTPDKTDTNFICRAQISKLESKTKEVEGLRNRASTLVSEIQELQDSCDKRLRTLLNRQQEACNGRIANRISTERKSFIMFKCANCKRLGKCQ